MITATSANQDGTTADTAWSIEIPKYSPITLSTNTGLASLPNANLYVPNEESETAYELATNYSTEFAHTNDVEGDMYRIHPILELVGEEIETVEQNRKYADQGTTVAGYTKTEAYEYEKYGYEVETIGLPVDTSTLGTKQVTYNLTQNGETVMSLTRNVEVVEAGEKPILMEAELDWPDTYLLGTYRSGKNTLYSTRRIKTITLLDYNTVPSGVVDSWDVSYYKDGSVMAWLIDAGIDETVGQMYDFYIGGNGGIKAPANSKALFSNYVNCTQINNIDLLDISEATNIEDMFYHSSSLETLDLSNWDISNVMDMDRMFLGCSALKSVNLSTWDTSSVETMNNMFNSCLALTSIDLSSFDTVNMIDEVDLDKLFYWCPSLETIILGEKFEKLNGYQMFYNCSLLERIITNRAITVSDDAMMLSSYSNIDLANLPNANLYVPNKASELAYESSEDYITVFSGDNDANGDIARISTILELQGDEIIRLLPNSTYNDAGATVAGFTEAESSAYTQYGFTLKTTGADIDTSKLGINKITYTLTHNGEIIDTVTRTVIIANEKTQNLMERENDAYAIGASRAGLTEYTSDKIKTITLLNTLEIPTDGTVVASWDVSFEQYNEGVMAWLKVNAEDSSMYDLYIGTDGQIIAPTDSSNLFAKYTNCTEINGLENLNTSSVRNMEEIFANLENITTISTENLDTTNVSNMQGMFMGCTNIENLKISSSSNLMNMQGMFDACSSLKTLDLSNFNTSNVDKMGYSFMNTSSLEVLVLGEKFDVLNGTSMFEGSNPSMKIIAQSEEPIELGNSTKLETLTSAILYVPNETSETAYESATNYANVFSGDKDTAEDVSRIRPILEMNGDSIVYAPINSNYEDAGVLVAGFTDSESGEYTKYGYTLTTTGLQVDTTTVGTYEVTYTLTDANSNEIATATRTVEVAILGTSKLMEREGYSYVSGQGEVWFALGAYRANKTEYTADKIAKIIITTKVPQNSSANWDVSYANDGSIKAYMVPNVVDSSKYDMHIVTSTFIELPEDSKAMFAEYENLTSIEGFSLIDGSKAKDMSFMFDENRSLTTLDLSGFETTSATDMECMFQNCNVLGTINLSSFDTSNVTDMNRMFYGCKALSTLDLSSFNTASVTDMEAMFYECEKVTSIILDDSFNTGNVTNMEHMFSKCYSLASVDVSGFNTSKVTYMNCMFQACENLAEINVSNFDTAKVTDMNRMFYGCKVVNTLDLSSFNTASVTDMEAMFYECISLETLDVSSFNTSNVTNMSYMFYDCNNATNIVLGANFNTSNVTNMEFMFSFCNALTTLDVSKFDTSKVTNMNCMFQLCESLTTLNVSNFDTSNVTTMENMFALSTNIQALDVSKWNTSNVTNMKQMFAGIEKIETLDLGNFDTSKVEDNEKMFLNCYELKSVLIGENFNKLDGKNMFGNDYELESIIMEKAASTSGDVTATVGINLYNMGIFNSITKFYVPNEESVIAYVEAWSKTNREISTNNIIPILKLVGSSSVKVRQNTQYTDKGVTVAGFTNEERENYSIYGYEVTTIGNVDTSILGTHTIEYILSRPTGTEVMRVARTVEVIASTGKPILMERGNDIDYVIGYERDGAWQGWWGTINSITLLDTNIVPDNAINSWDVSYFEDGSVMAWIVESEDSTTPYDLYIGGDGGIKAPSNSSNLFATGEFPATRAINNLDILDTSDVTNMSRMFYGDPEGNGALEGTLDVDSWDTSKVTDMSFMFYRQVYLTDLNISSWDTSNVTDMSYMFSNCWELTNLDVSNFNTSNVTNMQEMFGGCTNLKTLDLSSWNTSNVTNMNYMFSDVESILLGKNFNKFLSNSYMFSSSINEIITLRKAKNTTTVNFKVGDYVNYNPDTNTYSTDASKTGTDSVDLTTENVKWRIFDIDEETGDVLITTQGGVHQSGITLSGEQAAVGGVTELHNIAEALYSNSELGLTAKSMTEENFNNALEIVSGAYSDDMITGNSYGDKNAFYPEEANVSGTTEDGYWKVAHYNDTMYRNWDEPRFYTWDDGGESRIDENGLEYRVPTVDNPVKITDNSYVYYCDNHLSDNENWSIIKEVLGDDSRIWIAAQAMKYFAYPGVEQDIMLICSGIFNYSSSSSYVDYANLIWSCGESHNDSYGLQPVVRIPAQMITSTSETQDGKTADTAWEITNESAISLGINTSLSNLPNAILYVPDETSETNYEAATNYDTELGPDRIKPILSLLGDKQVTINKGETYTDAGATLGDGTNEDAFTNYGFTYETRGADIDTSRVGTNEVTYVLRRNGEQITTVTRTVEVVDNTVVPVPGSPIIMEREQSTAYILGAERANLTYKASDVKTITLQSSNTVPTDGTVVASWDASLNEDTSVMAWIVANGDKYDLYIGGNGGLIAPENVSSLFANYTSCETITGLNILNTSMVTNMNAMFANANALTSIDLGNFDTDNVTDMSEMFEGCSALTALDVGKLNTEKVTSMREMFANVSAPTINGLNKFDTTNVSDMSGMFMGCTNITNLDLNNFETTNLMNMNSMFDACSSLETLYLHSFNTRNVSEMNYAFMNTSSLEVIILGEEFNKLNGTRMFEGSNNALTIITHREPQTAAQIIELGSDTKLETLANAVLYVPSENAEGIYEGNEVYTNAFTAERIKPILEVVGNIEKTILLNSTYVDEGALVLGFAENDKTNYQKYGYTLTTTGASIDTSVQGVNEVTYTLTYKNPNDENASSEVISTATRTVEVLFKLIEGTLTLSGDSVYDETLEVVITLDDTTITPTYEYKWYVSDTNSLTGGELIENATGSTYKIPGGLDGKYIYVEVIANADKHSETIFTAISECIEKATPVFTIDKTTINLVKGTNTTVTVQYSGDGDLDAESDDTGIATAEVVSNTITITGVSAGKTTITVTLQEGTNYLAAESKTIEVTVIANYYDGTNYYRTLADALDNASAVSTITVLKDVTENEMAVILEGSTITLDLNGHTITADIITEDISFISNEGTLIIDDTSANKNGVIKTKENTVNELKYLINTMKDSVLTLNEGTLVHNGLTLDEWYTVRNRGTFTMNGGQIKQAGERSGDYVGTAVYAYDGNVTINGGIIEAIDGVAILNSNTNSIVTIGNSGDSMNQSSPLIIGSSYAVDSKNGFNFYDGTLKGIDAAYRGEIKDIASDCTLLHGTEEKNGDIYNVAKLSAFTAEIEITGNNIYGETLTAEITKTGEVEPSYKYEWYVNNEASTSGGTKIENESGETYRIGEGLVEKYIYVVVTATVDGMEITFTDVIDSPIAKKPVLYTEGQTSFTYDGETKTYLPENFDAEIIEISNNKEKDAGDYNATLHLKDTENYAWEDGNIEDKQVAWRIEFAESILTLTPNSITMFNGETVSIYYEYIGDGEINATAPEGSVIEIVSVNESEKKIEIRANDYGETTITVYTLGSTNYIDTLKTASVRVADAAYTDGENFYPSLKAALANCGSNVEIKVLKDVIETEVAVLETGKAVTLNLNGSTISTNITGSLIENNGTLRIVNTGFTSGSIYGTNAESVIKNNSTLTIDGDIVISGGTHAIINNDKLNIISGIYQNASENAVILNNENASINMEDGEIIGTTLAIENSGSLVINSISKSATISGDTAISNKANGTGDIYGATITGTVNNTGVGTLKINDSVISAGNTAITASNGTVEVINSTLTNVNVAVETTNNGIVKVNGGTINNVTDAIVNNGGTVDVINANITVSSNALVNNSGETNLVSSNITVTGDEAVIITNNEGTTNISDMEVAATTSIAIENEGTTNITNDSIITASNDVAIVNKGTLTIQNSLVENTNVYLAIENSGSLNANAATIKSKDTVINNTNVANINNSEITSEQGTAITTSNEMTITGDTSVTGINGIENTGTLTLGVDDASILRDVKVTATVNAITNNGTFNWYDGEFSGRVTDIYVGNAPKTKIGNAIVSSISGNVETRYLEKDGEAPVIKEIITATDWIQNSDTIQVIATDNIKVTGYAFTENAETPALDSNVWQTVNTLIVYENKTYYIHVRDEAGNITSTSVEIKWICENIWNTTGENGDETRAILTEDGTLIFEVVGDGEGEIRDYADENSAPWANNENVEKVIISEGITSIGDYSAANLPNVTEITIPSSLVDISETALVKTNNYEELNVSNDNPNYKAKDLALYDKEETIIYSYSTKNDETSLTLPDTIEKIAPGAFHGNETLEKIITSKNITEVGEGAFENVSGDVYYYASSEGMSKYVEENEDEADFILIDDIKPEMESIEINNGDDITEDRNVTITITATDNVEITKVFISEELLVSEELLALPENSWIDYNENVDYTLSDGEESKTVYVWVKDEAGNISSYASDTIFYGEINFTLNGDKLVVQYVDTTTKDYYEYKEDIQGGYTAGDNVQVVVEGTVDHEATGENEITYTVSIDGTEVATFTRIVDIIENSWTGETGTSNDWSYVIHANGKYAKLTGYNGAYVANMVVPVAINHNGNEIRVIDIGVDGIGANAVVTKLTLPETLINISENAFSGLEALSEINIPLSVMSIDGYAFRNSGLAAGINEFKPSANLRELKANALVDANIKHIELVEGIKAIGENALRNASGTDVAGNTLHIPASLVEIGESAFVGYKVEDITVSANSNSFKLAEDDVSLVDYSGNTLMLYPVLRNYEQYEIPSTITNIYAGAFAQAENIKRMNIPANVTQIGAEAFAGMTSVSNITIEGTPEIKENAFSGDTALTRIMLTSNVGMASLENINAIPVDTFIYVPSSMESIYEADDVYSSLIGYETRISPIIALNGESNYIQVINEPYVEEGVKLVNETFTLSGTSSYIAGLEVVIEGEVDSTISDRYEITYIAKYNGTEVDRVVRYVDVGDGIAPEITNVTTEEKWQATEQTFIVTAKDNIEVVGYIIKQTSDTPSRDDSRWQTSNEVKATSNGPWYIFAKDGMGNVSKAFKVIASWICSGIYDISEAGDGSVLLIISEDETEIRITGTGKTKDFGDDEPLPWASSLDKVVTVTIEEGITSLGENLISDMPNAETISVAKSVEEIANSAFAGTNNFNNFYLNGNTNFVYEDGTLYDASIETLYVHTNKHAQTYELPETITTICDKAFEGNTVISYLDLSNVKEIGDEAFSGMTHLGNVFISKELETIGENVFKDAYGPIYFYSSTLVMVEYVENFGDEAPFIEIDDVLPTISKVTINEDLETTNNANVTLRIEASDNIGITKVLIEETLSGSVTSGDNRWENYSTEIPYTLTKVNATNTVYVWVMDATGNISSTPASDSIYYTNYEFHFVNGAEIVQYVDTEGFDDFIYNEEVQGGFTISNPDIEVAVSGTVDHTQVGKYEIKYTLTLNGSFVAQYVREVNVIADEYDNTFYTEGDFTYQLHKTENYARIIKYNGTETEVTIPEIIVNGENRYKVIDIDSLVDDEGVFPVDVEKVNVPDTLISVGENAFMNLSNMHMISLPISVMQIEDNALKNCTIQMLTLSDNVRKVGSNAFENNSFVKVTLGKLLNVIYEGAFKNAGTVDTLSIPAEINEISEGSFQGMMIGKIEMSDVIEDAKYTVTENVLFDREDKVILQVPTSSINGEFVFDSEVERIGVGAFMNATGMTKAIFSGDFKEIGEEAFRNTGLVEFVVPSTVKTISENTFSDNQNLEIVIIEDAVAIKEEAFANSDKLNTLIILHDELEMTTLENANAIPANAVIYVPNETVYEAAGNFNTIDAERIKNVMSLNGDSVITIEAGDGYIEQGVYVVDELFTEDGVSTVHEALTFEVTKAFDNTILGEQEIIYSLKSRGTIRIIARRTIITQDTQAPIIERVNTLDEPQALKERFYVIATDNLKVTGYAISKSNVAPDLNSDEWTENAYVDATENTTWYIFARDEAGNISDSVQVEATHICKAKWDVGVVTDTVYAIITLDNELVFVGEGEVKFFEKDELPWKKEYLNEITGVVIEEGITALPDYTLTDIKNAEFISIPSTLESVELSTFGGTNNFDNILIPNGSETFVYEDYTLYSKDKNILYVHSNKDTNAQYEIDENVKVIANYAFVNNANITNIITTSNPTVTEGAFKDAKNIEEITGEIGGTAIEDYAFAGASKLGSIEISEDVEKIGSYVFSGCDMLTSIDLTDSENLKVLEHHAFANLNNIAEMVIPKGIETITADESGDKEVFENLGSNLQENAKVYYFEECDAMDYYAKTSPDKDVDFILMDTIGPRLESLRVVNLEKGSYAAGTKVTIKATFTESFKEDKGTMPVLSIVFGNGEVIKLEEGIVDGVAGEITYYYEIKVEDLGAIRCASFVGELYDVTNNASSHTTAEFDGNIIVARTSVEVENAGEDVKYFSNLNDAVLYANGASNIKMLLDEEITSSIKFDDVNSNTIFDLNRKVVTINLEAEDTAIVNAGKLTISGDGRIVVSGSTENVYGIANTGNVEVINGTIRVDAKETSNAYGIYVSSIGTLKVSGGTVEAISQKGDAHGILNYNQVEIAGGKVSANSSAGKAYAVHNAKDLIVTAGSIVSTMNANEGGRTYGIYNEMGNVRIGEDDGNISLTVPSIYATHEGIRNVSGRLEFYDGVVEGAAHLSVITDEITTVDGYELVKTLTSTREKATLGVDESAPEITLTNLTPGWTNKEVTIKVKVTDKGSGVQKLTCNGEEINLVANEALVPVDANDTYTFVATDYAGNETPREITITNIDKVAPVINDVTYDATTGKEEVILKVTAQDALSGLYGYAIATSNTEPTSWEKLDKVITDVQTLNIPITANDEYYVFVRDAAGNVVRYEHVIKITNVDASAPQINKVTIVEGGTGFADTSTVRVNVDATDDIGIEYLLLSNTALTVAEVKASDKWVPYSESVLWQLPIGDKDNTVYVWAKDAAGRISLEASDSTKLLAKYIGNDGTNETSFKVLIKDTNYNFSKTLGPSDVRIKVKTLGGTWDAAGGAGSIEIQAAPVIYGPVEEGAEVVNGRYYTIIARNITGNGTVYLVFNENAEADMAGNKLNTLEIPTDVTVEQNKPTIEVTSTEVIVRDADHHSMNMVKVNGKTVILDDDSTISLTKLKETYGIEIVSGTVLETVDRCGNVGTKMMP